MRSVLLTIGEVAAQFKCSERTVERWTEAGRLPVVKVGGLVRYRQEDVDKLATPEGAT